MSGYIPVRKHGNSVLEAEFLYIYKILNSLVSRLEKLEKRITVLEEQNS